MTKVFDRVKLKNVLDTLNQNKKIGKIIEELNMDTTDRCSKDPTEV